MRELFTKIQNHKVKNVACASELQNLLDQFAISVAVSLDSQRTVSYFRLVMHCILVTSIEPQNHYQTQLLVLEEIALFLYAMFNCF